MWLMWTGRVTFATTFGGSPAVSLPIARSRSVALTLSIMVWGMWEQSVSVGILDFAADACSVVLTPKL